MVSMDLRASLLVLRMARAKAMAPLRPEILGILLTLTFVFNHKKIYILYNSNRRMGVMDM